MKVSRIILALIASAIVATTHAESNDSIKLVRLEQTLQKEIKARESLKTELALQKDLIKSQAGVIDSLRSAIDQNARNIKTTADEIGVKIDETNSTLGSKADSSDVKSKTIWGGIILILLAILGAIVYYLLHKRINKGNADVNALMEKSDKLNEQILNQFSLEMAEMQKISASLAAIEKTNGQQGSTSSEPDHSLIKTLADRITFMEMTLFKMDPKVRGYKQLSKSISQMKDNLLANGYELVDMLGKPYNDGMKVTANFIEDEDLEEGTQIITGIIKPQINFNGKMIQSAQITVSQNI
jgi:hypothetical protein